ncbi:MAG: hypothetical protein C5B59_08675 [Bacteroidetes bacterium]|nr:MAG: hypothetical protein C5B59_08675 [Bacteroidota bacterium]
MSKAEDLVKNVSEKVEKNETATEELARIQLESARLQKKLLEADLEAKELEQQERQFNLKDLKGRLADRQLKEVQAQQKREAQGRTFAQEETTDRVNFAACSHRKGGIVSPRDMRALTRGGDEDQYSVIKHQMINGDIWVRCLRCRKTWTPPVKSNFYFRDGKVVAPKDGVFSQEKFDAAVAEYKRAVQFPTRNVMSGSVQCRFFTVNEAGQEIDGAAQYRENVKDSNLR